MQRFQLRQQHIPADPGYGHGNEDGHLIYANLFMDRLERAFLAQEPILPLVWKCYIDDILCIWTGSRSQLDNFLDRLNKIHPYIKFTWSISDTQEQFLHLNIHKGERFSQTNLLDLKTYFKPTNTFQYLHFASSHPRRVFMGLVKGEAIRFLRSNTHAPAYSKRTFSAGNTPKTL